MTTRSNSPASDSGLRDVLNQLVPSTKSRGGYESSLLGENDYQTVRPRENSSSESIDIHAYLAQLRNDQNNLRSQSSGQFKHLQKILDKEISSVMEEIARQSLSDTPSSVFNTKGEKVNLTKLVMVPIDKYPKYNFVGRILGPRGMTVRQLEEETGCKIMVRGRGSCKVGMRRDRGTDDEPLHVLVQCEDYPDAAEEKMANALKVVNDLLTPPPDGKDELKRKQLIELSIINGTYRPTAATKVALQPPTPSASSHLSSPRRNSLFHPYGTHGDSSSNGLEHLLLAGLLGHQPTVNPLAAEYAKTLLALSMTNTPAPSPSLLDMGHYSSASSPSTGVIQQASLHQYIEATAMINAIPSFHDGSGDGPKKH